MKSKIFIAVCIGYGLIGCNVLPSETPEQTTSQTECQAATSKATNSSNGAQLLFCDGFDQSAGKLSTVGSTNWMDQN